MQSDRALIIVIAYLRLWFCEYRDSNKDAGLAACLVFHYCYYYRYTGSRLSPLEAVCGTESVYTYLDSRESLPFGASLAYTRKQ
jgi:hypothetical protein